MKKVVLAVLLLALGFSMVACANGKSTIQLKEPDLSKYPEQLHDWSAEQLRDYFVEAGIFTNEWYTMLQDHESSYQGLPISGNTGYADKEWNYYAVIFTMMKDDSEGSVEDYLNNIRENRAFPYEMGGLPVDHLADNVIFSYSWSEDQSFKDAMEAAYNRLITELGITPDF